MFSGESALLFCICCSLAIVGVLFAGHAKADSDDQAWRAALPESIRLVLDVAEPLTHPRGERLPLYLWPAMNPDPLSDADAERLVRELDQRGIGLICSWRAGAEAQSLEAAMPVARAQHRLGLAVNINATQPMYSFFNGDEATAHIDDEGNPFWDDSFGKQHMGCPFALEHRKAPMRERLQPFIERYKEEGISIGFIFADWEIDGPIEWNGAWEASRRCVRCRDEVPNIDNFLDFQKRLRDIRSELQRDVFAMPMREAFPGVLVGNYAVYPNNGWRYWYDYFETIVEGQPEVIRQRARYRHWANEFESAGYTFAMPVVYTWSWTYDWYDFDVPDYRWFYNMFKVGSNAAAHRHTDVPIITFVHWHTVNVGRNVGAGAEEGGATVPQLTEWAYKELLWHLLLRGHDTFFLWCMASENEKEVALLHPVWAAAQQYGAFLDEGTPISFSVPDQPATIVSGLRKGDEVLVRRTDFVQNDSPVSVTIGDRTIVVPPANDECLVLRLEP